MSAHLPQVLGGGGVTMVENPFQKAVARLPHANSSQYPEDDSPAHEGVRYSFSPGQRGLICDHPSQVFSAAWDGAREAHLVQCKFGST